MSVVHNLAVLAVRELVEGACALVEMRSAGRAVELVGNFLAARFSSIDSQRLSLALQGANDRAWQSLEIALAGESFWDRCKEFVSRAESRAFAQQVRAFLDAHPLPEFAGKAAYRQRCLQELRAARQSGALTPGRLDPDQLARSAGTFAQFRDPQSVFDAEWRLIADLAEGLRQAGYKELAWFVAQRPVEGMPLLIVGVRYYFRRAVEEDPKLFQGLAFAKLESLAAAQQQGFAALSAALVDQGQRLEELLTVAQRSDERLSDMQKQIAELMRRFEMRDQQVRPNDTTSIRTEDERQLVRAALARYRALPEAERRQRPALLSSVARLENAAGNHDQAVADYRLAATLAGPDAQAQAAAHHNAYRAALERASSSKRPEDWTDAFRAFAQAVNLDRRYLPFDARKYQPQRILGAGGFGVTFLCKRRGPDDWVAVKSLLQENLGRDLDKVLDEGRLLGQLDHPAIVRMIDCDYVDHDTRTGPYVVMEFFDGVTLEDYVGPGKLLAPDQAAPLFRLAAEGLQAAHARGVWHRDIKPANILVRREGGGWRLKIIDFGLALRRELTAAGKTTCSVRQGKTLVGGSIAGTLHYAAPEQMDPDRQKEIGPWSDVYGFGKTCYYALFATPTPDDDDKDTLPEGLKRLLSRCTAQTTNKRPQSFAEVVEQLGHLAGGSVTVTKEEPILLSLVEEGAPPPPPALPAAQWYYLKGARQCGPLSEAELRAQVAAGGVAPADLIWKQGLHGWVPAGSVFPVAPPPVATPLVARIQIEAAAPNTVTHVAGKAVRGYIKLATYGLLGGKVFGSDTLKFYLESRLIGEGSLMQGFQLDVSVPPGRYKMSVAHWVGNSESDRKEFDLDVRRPGDYQLRFNYVRGTMGGMSGSTLDILRDPGFVAAPSRPS